MKDRFAPRAVAALRSFEFSPKRGQKCVSCLPSSGGPPTVPPELTKSLKKISGKINTVLSVLGSMSQQHATTPVYSGFPQPQPQSSPTPGPASASFPGMPPVHAPEHARSASPPALRLSESWNRPPQGSAGASPLFSTPISSVLKGGKPTHTRTSPREWVQLCWPSLFCGCFFFFPSRSSCRHFPLWSHQTTFTVRDFQVAFPFVSACAVTADSRDFFHFQLYPLFLKTDQILSYFWVCVSDYGRGLQSVYGPVETSSHRLERMMNSNKRWLEKRKNDASVYPFSPLHTR